LSLLLLLAGALAARAQEAGDAPPEVAPVEVDAAAAPEAEAAAATDAGVDADAEAAAPEAPDAPEPPGEPEEGEAALPPAGEVIVLSDDTFGSVGRQSDIMLVNFYADWCRFSQMLKPIYAAAARQMASMPNVRLGSVNCEADDTVEARESNHISKYPTIKVFRRGVALKSEYRGQRSPAAMEQYVKELLASAMEEVNSEEEITTAVEREKRLLVGLFNNADHPSRANYAKIADQLRDECQFAVHDGSTNVGDAGAAISFRTPRNEDVYPGDMADHDELFSWTRNHCNPMVREITFENGEELTEEGLPFLIMFYDPDDHTPVDDFTEIVNKRFPQERGNINFITADGSKFAHPLRHLGMTKKDLPVLAFDTFKHMHLFKRFSNVYREGILEKFVDDLHTGKLHHNFHHPPADGEEEVYDKNDANQIEGAGADPSAGDARAAGADGAAAPAAGADGTATTPEGGGEEAKVEVDLDIHPEDHDSDKDGDGKEDTLKDKLEHAEKAKNPDVPEVTTKKVSTPGENRNANEEEHDESHEDMSKPVAVKSILKNLKPSSNRYSFSHNRDEF